MSYARAHLLLLYALPWLYALCWKYTLHGLHTLAALEALRVPLLRHCCSSAAIYNSTTTRP